MNPHQNSLLIRSDTAVPRSKTTELKYLKPRYYYCIPLLPLLDMAMGDAIAMIVAICWDEHRGQP